jgi:hypothetical protein
MVALVLKHATPYWHPGRLVTQANSSRTVWAKIVSLHAVKMFLGYPLAKLINFLRIQ